MAKWLGLNKLKLNPDRTEIMLIGRADVLKDFVLPSFDKVQLTLAELVKGLMIILDQALLLKK